MSEEAKKKKFSSLGLGFRGGGLNGEKRWSELLFLMYVFRVYFTDLAANGFTVSTLTNVVQTSIDHKYATQDSTSTGNTALPIHHSFHPQVPP